tara:strand:- start:320 stop:772 length:453 start_codon:yes stop_codon:yes gene_type:complete
MSKETENKKKVQLGMAQGTARNKLVKNMMFDMACKLDLNWCYQCGAKIETKEELGIEHKTPWLDSDNPKELYFDLDNIAFSHQGCNSGAARRNTESTIAANEKKRNKTSAGLHECGCCKKLKPSTEFTKRANRWNGLHWNCRECKNSKRN